MSWASKLRDQNGNNGAQSECLIDAATSQEGTQSWYSPALGNDNSPLAFNLIRARIDDCLENHEDCKVAVSGNIINEYWEPELPKRVLAIQTDSISSQIRLLATDGLRGNYAALSYCWGPREKHPLRTTNANLKDHLNNIAFETLPKTFQDAIVVTSAVGLRFLWIDSLCIVQDDTQDWLEESAAMGSIYEKARLTIAASAAEDPTEGCFQSIRPAQHVIEVPYYSSAKKMCGSFYISTISQYDSSPAWGPLKKRAWAFQEWRLSRRIVHFTKGGLSWKCKRFESCERGTSDDFQEYPQWDSLVQSYSECELTFETDRLIALQGLVNEMQKATLDRYHAGIWEADLPQHLLWMVCEDESDIHGLPMVPSWSWASQPGWKLIWSTQDYEFNCVNVAFCNMMTENTDIIKLKAPLKQCMISKHEINQNRFSDLPTEGKSPEKDMMSFRDGPIHYIQGIGSQSQHLVGLAALDIEQYTDIYCLFLASSARFNSDPLYRTSPKDTTIGQSFQTKTGNEEGMELDELRNSEVFIKEVLERHGGGQHVHWVLLLQASPQGPGRFRRVGMGIIWSESWAPQAASRVYLELV